jgi:hypothetical protein
MSLPKIDGNDRDLSKLVSHENSDYVYINGSLYLMYRIPLINKTKVYMII